MTPKLGPKERAAIKLLAERARLMVALVPEGVPDEFCMKLTAFVNYLLDVRMLPSLPMPAVKVGDGMSCPYCHVRVTTDPASFSDHLQACDFRKAIERWAMGNMQIDSELKV